MRNLEFTGIYFGETVTLKQVSKPSAKKLFNEGKSIFIQTSKFHPLGVCSQALQMDNKESTFEEIVNSFKYYNCSNEAGKYVTFYLRVN